MFKLHKINPMVRAVGTMGAVAALVAGITFAQQTSNTVTLNNNTLDSATATLAISSVAGDTSCTTTPSSSATGMDFSSLVPGVSSAPFDFCLDNTGTAPLALTVSTPTTFSSTPPAIPPSDITLAFSCNNGGGTLTTTLDTLSSATAFTSSSIAAGTNSACTVTATLTSSYSSSGGDVTPFVLDFSGTSS